MRRVHVLSALASLAALVAGGACSSLSGLSDAPDFEVIDGAPGDGHGGSLGDGGPTFLDGPVECNDPGTTACGSSCVDTKTDRSNCGRCGHDCLGGACADGTCGAVTLADDLKTPQGIAVAKDALYVTLNGDGAVVRVAKDKPGNPTVLTRSTSSPAGIAVQIDATGNAVRMIWGEERTSANVSVCDLPACSSVTTIAASGDVQHIVVVGDVAYWAESTSSTGKVRKCTMSDCARSATDVLPTEPGAYGLAIAGDNLFVSRRESAGSVRRASVGTVNGTSSDFITGLETPVGIATDGKNVYATNAPFGQPGGIVTCALSGCANGVGGTPFGAADNPHDVATDGVDVFWNNGLANGGSMMWCPVSGCAGGAKTLASPQTNPFSIVTDDQAVYWTNVTSPGQVMKIAKP